MYWRTLMEFEFTWIEPSLVAVRTSGLASADGFEALFGELSAQPEFGPGVKMLSDHTNLDVSALTAVDIERITAIRAVYTRSLGARSALVVGSDSPAKYGLARMFEAFAVSGGEDSVRVFETTEEAMAWLEADDSGSASPA